MCIRTGQAEKLEMEMKVTWNLCACYTAPVTGLNQ